MKVNALIGIFVPKDSPISVEFNGRLMMRSAISATHRAELAGVAIHVYCPFFTQWISIGPASLEGTGQKQSQSNPYNSQLYVNAINSSPTKPILRINTEWSLLHLIIRITQGFDSYLHMSTRRCMSLFPNLSGHNHCLHQRYPFLGN